MNNTNDTREVWQRGPVQGVPSLLQPVAHALLQAAEEVERYMEDFPKDLLWERPRGVASVGFHLLHIRGVVDRLFTYAQGQALTAQQLKELAIENAEASAGLGEPAALVASFRSRVLQAIEQLGKTSEATLVDARALGRKQIPTTVIGLLFHAAEHTQRHVGQLLVTARMLRHS
jgi:uncharacterized damage-inducible protein DinB